MYIRPLLKIYDLYDDPNDPNNPSDHINLCGRMQLIIGTVQLNLQPNGAFVTWTLTFYFLVGFLKRNGVFAT